MDPISTMLLVVFLTFAVVLILAIPVIATGLVLGVVKRTMTFAFRTKNRLRR
jgi:hypothetical protein